MNIKKVADWYKSRKQRIIEAVQGPIYAAKIMRTFFAKGAVEVSTAFECNGKKYDYQTLIQLDGDIFFYLPNPKQLDDKGLQTMQAAYLTHKINVNKVVAAFEDNTNFFSRIFDGFLLLINFYPLIHLFEELLELLGLDKGTFEAKEFGWDAAIVVASLLARRFLRPQIFSLSFKAITAIGRFFKWF